MSSSVGKQPLEIKEINAKLSDVEKSSIPEIVLKNVTKLLALTF